MSLRAVRSTYLIWRLRSPFLAKITSTSSSSLLYSSVNPDYSLWLNVIFFGFILSYLYLF